MLLLELYSSSSTTRDDGFFSIGQEHGTPKGVPGSSSSLIYKHVTPPE